MNKGIFDRIQSCDRGSIQQHQILGGFMDGMTTAVPLAKANETQWAVYRSTIIPVMDAVTFMGTGRFYTPTYGNRAIKRLYD